MPAAKKPPNLNSTESIQPDYDDNSNDEDDDLFISVWDGKSTKNTSGKVADTKPKPLPDNTGAASGSNKTKQNTSGSKVLNNNVNGLEKPSCSGMDTTSTDKQDLDGGLSDRDLPSSSVNSSKHNQDRRGRRDSDSTTNDWDRPSCSGLNIRDFDSFDLSFDADRSDDLSHLKTMFPSLDEEVLKSYVDIYQDIEECVRVISNLMYGGEEEDDVHFMDGIQHESTLEDSSTNFKQESTTNSAETETKFSPNKLSDSSAKLDTRAANASRENGTVNSVARQLESNLNSTDALESKAPLASKRRGDLASNSSLSSVSQSSTTQPKSIVVKKESSTNEPSLNVTLASNQNAESKPPKIDIKAHKTDTKPFTNQPLSSNDTIQVGIDIRFGNNKVHPSMRRCVDRSLASRDIAQPYTGNTTSDTKSSPKSHDPKSKPSDLKHKLSCPITTCNSSPPKRVCHGSSSQKISYSTRSDDFRNASPTSSHSSNVSVTKSSTSKMTYSHSSTHDSSSSDTKSDDFRNTSPTLSHSSNVSVTKSSTSKMTYSHSSTHDSSSSDTKSDDFRSIPSTSRNTSDFSVSSLPPENTRKSSQPIIPSSLDFSSFIDSVSRRLLESQGNFSLNNSTTGTPSKKGKGPAPFPLSKNADPGIVIDWGNMSLAENIQPQVMAPVKTTGGQSSSINQGNTPFNSNKNIAEAIVKQEKTKNIDNQDSSQGTASPNRYVAEYFGQKQFVLVVKKDQSTSDANQLGSQNQDNSSPLEDDSTKEEVARQEMLDLQRDTEMLTKVCPDDDPNYIFSRLEELKDNPNRVAIVNKELIENASTSGVENIIQKQKKVVWFWEDKKMRHVPFSKAESNIIESKYTKHDGSASVENVQFLPVTLVLRFNFKHMTVQETLKNKIKHVYRTETMEEVSGKEDQKGETDSSLAPLSNPETWHGHENSSSTNTMMTRDLFEVLPGTSEFAHVDGLLKKSLPQAVTKKIKRVKNDWLERKYGMQRILLREKNGPSGINEKELFHGTRKTPPSMIWNSEDGFDMRFSADGMWGRGCYFAVHAAYSHHQFTHQYIHKNRRYYQIFLAHVLTGESVSMNPDRSIRKPPINAATARQYDSVTGITQNHQIYVLYKNEASFPAYLITYTM